jgi:hypothetical protein
MRSFDIEAEDVLRARAPEIAARFLSNQLEGSWHPNGFAVFHAGEVEGLGRMRLHIWARDQRVALDGQPAIHSHPWSLCSLVIAGCYEDVIYQAEEFNAAAPDRLQGYRIRFGAVGQGDETHPVPIWYRLTAIEHRTVVAGQLHRLASGVLHATHVPYSGFAATLVVTSQVIEPDKLLLIGDQAFGARVYVRPAVAANDVARMQHDLRLSAYFAEALQRTSEGR